MTDITVNGGLYYDDNDTCETVDLIICHIEMMGACQNAIFLGGQKISNSGTYANMNIFYLN